MKDCFFHTFWCVAANEVQRLKMESASDSASGSSKFCFHKPSFSLFLPSIIVGKISVTRSPECIIRFGSVLQINVLQCFLRIIFLPRQEPRHHTVISRLTAFPSYFQSKLRPLCIWIVPGSSESWLFTSARFCPTIQALQGPCAIFSRYNKGQITYSLLC